MWIEELIGFRWTFVSSTAATTVATGHWCRETVYRLVWVYTGAPHFTQPTR